MLKNGKLTLKVRANNLFDMFDPVNSGEIILVPFKARIEVLNML